MTSYLFNTLNGRSFSVPPDALILTRDSVFPGAVGSPRSLSRLREANQFHFNITLACIAHRLCLRILFLILFVQGLLQINIGRTCVDGGKSGIQNTSDVVPVYETKLEGEKTKLARVFFNNVPVDFKLDFCRLSRYITNTGKNIWKHILLESSSCDVTFCKI